MTDYVTLANSDGTLSKYFLCLDQERVNTRNRSVTQLTSGRAIAVQGRPRVEYNLTLLVEETPDSGYGDLDDLRRFYEYRSPHATPSNEITVTLVDGTVVQGVIESDMPERPETVTLVGAGAYYRIVMRILDVTRYTWDHSSAEMSQYLCFL